MIDLKEVRWREYINDSSFDPMALDKKIYSVRNFSRRYPPSIVIKTKRHNRRRFKYIFPFVQEPKITVVSVELSSKEIRDGFGKHLYEYVRVKLGGTTYRIGLGSKEYYISKDTIGTRRWRGPCASFEAVVRSMYGAAKRGTLPLHIFSADMELVMEHEE